MIQYEIIPSQDLNTNQTHQTPYHYSNTHCAILSSIQNYETNKHDLLYKRGIFIYGQHGIGKTTLVKNILSHLNYETLYFSAGDLNDKTFIEQVSSTHSSNVSVISIFNRIKLKAIIIDDIELLNSGEKTGIPKLIKLLRPKKTKKQKLEPYTKTLVICINNMSFDKKMRELKDTCKSIYIRNPNNIEIQKYILHANPQLNYNDIKTIVSYTGSNIRKIQNILKMYTLNKSIVKNLLFSNKYLIYDTKDIVHILFQNKICMREHNSMIDEQDRTSLSLYIHENIIHYLPYTTTSDLLHVYNLILKNLCYVDTLDGIIFQKQIWSLNELSSMIKNIINPYMLHTLKENKYIHANEKKKPSNKNPQIQMDLVEEINTHETSTSTIRFTKVLTKYSSEYNNYMFIQDICQKLQMNKSDVIFYFEYLQTEYHDIQTIYEILETYEIGKLYTDRMFRYIQTIHKKC